MTDVRKILICVMSDTFALASQDWNIYAMKLLTETGQNGLHGAIAINYVAIEHRRENKDV